MKEHEKELEQRLKEISVDLRELCKNQREMAVEWAESRAELNAHLSGLSKNVETLSNLLLGNGQEGMVSKVVRLEEKTEGFSRAEEKSTHSTRYWLTTVVSVLAFLVSLGAVLNSCH